MTKTEVRVSQQHPSLVGVDPIGASRVLLDDHRLTLATAAAVVARMRAAPRDRDEEGLAQLIKVVSEIKVSASYLGRATLREVAVDLERVLDHQLLASSAAKSGVFDVLGDSLDYMAQEMKALETGVFSQSLTENSLSLCARIGRWLAERPSALPDANTFFEAFKEDSLRHLDSCREAVIAASAQKDGTPAAALHSAFRAVHTLKGNAGLLGLSGFEDMGRAVEQVLDGLRSSALVLTSSLSVALLDLLDAAAAALPRSKAADFSTEISALEVAEGEAKLVAKRTRLGDLLVDSNLVTREQVDLVLAIKRDPLGVALMRLNALSELQLAEALELQRRLRSSDDTPSIMPPAPRRPRPRLVQVDARALERLQQRVAAIAESCGAAAPGMRQELAELREIVQAMGRVPLRRVFQKMALLVNDLAGQRDKNVRLSLEGEDLQVAERLAAPLEDAVVHLARNAVDHGIEPQAERLARGKAAQGRIALIAREAGGGLAIEMTDDGRGLDREALLRRAVEMGVVPEAERAALSDAQVAELVFAPGLSTALQVTDTSGRGVGMDAVRESIERVGGMVTIASRPGEGTRVTFTFSHR